jgi:hypothetical protein
MRSFYKLISLIYQENNYMILKNNLLGFIYHLKIKYIIVNPLRIILFLNNIFEGVY